MKIVVTAGPTREFIDPVRFLSNPSTGKMGFEIAAEAARRGHKVTLVTGPVSLKTPKGVKRVDVVSALDMLDATLKATTDVKSLQDVPVTVVAAAAVADWRPAECAKTKLKKTEMSDTLKLERTPDILKALSGIESIRLVGFAAETDNVIAEAARKCREKKLKFIVANDVTETGCGFGTDTNRVTFVFPDGTEKRFPLMSKRMVAKRIIDEISAMR